MPLLSIQHLRKSFGPVTVLKDISFSLERGRILGLVGENGAGKSTLVRCICGHLRADGGELALGGRAYLVPQEFTLVPTMSVAENLFLGREPVKAGLVDRRTLRDRTARALAAIGASSINPDTLVETLGVADKQKTELAKALVEKADLLVLDEPTTVLSRAETEALFAVLRRLRDEGVGMLYISHKLDEVRDLCDEVAVLRDGALVAQGPSASFTSRDLASRMVGRPLEEIYPPKRPDPDPSAEPALEAGSLSDGDRVLDASFSLRPGEILGLAGLAGAGRTELSELLCGERPRKAGSLRLFGREVRFRSMRDAQKAGLAYLSEDRQGTALLTDSTIRENTTLSSLGKYRIGPFVSWRRADAATRALIGELHTRCEGPAQPVRALSGGNQQKVAIAKGLDTEPRIFIFDEPTRGVDVGARAEIYRILHDLADRGTAILLISSDLGEIIGNCTRTLVMREGRIVGELRGDDVNERSIMLLATGVSD